MRSRKTPGARKKGQRAPLPHRAGSIFFRGGEPVQTLSSSLAHLLSHMSFCNDAGQLGLQVHLGNGGAWVRVSSKGHHLMSWAFTAASLWVYASTVSIGEDQGRGKPEAPSVPSRCSCKVPSKQALLPVNFPNVHLAACLMVYPWLCIL